MYCHRLGWALTITSIAVGLSCIPFFQRKRYSSKEPRAWQRTAFDHLRKYFIDRYPKFICRWSLRIYGSMGGAVYRIGRSTVLKYGDEYRSHEPETMLFIQEHTSIPVPRVYDHWLSDGALITLMEWVDGRTLEAAWPDLTHTEKIRIFAQLKRYVEELRSLEQPPSLKGVISTFDGRPVSDALLSNKPCGPFQSDLEFNEFLVSRFDFIKQTEAGRIEFEELRTLVHQTPYRRVVFTHSDIMPRNILLDSNNNIVSILDWEMAGWRPEQWEYLKSMWMGQYDPGWPDYVPLFLDAYKEDLQLHMKMCEMHGSPF